MCKKEGKSTALEGYPVGIGSVHLHSGGLINNVGSHYQRGYTHWMDTLDTCIPWTYTRNNQDTLFVDIEFSFAASDILMEPRIFFR